MRGDLYFIYDFFKVLIYLYFSYVLVMFYLCFIYVLVLLQYKCWIIFGVCKVVKI